MSEDQPHGELDEIARSLAQGRPVPSPGFRGELGWLLRSMPLPRRVRHLRVKALGLAVCGAALLALAGAGVAGRGPLAPSQTAASSASAVHAH